ncbi:hypothetical protein ON010_g18709 [Phytophthora cinnamomi]|nr:hypothetical protein ON010_g18709 [Phytophthora cinnamomi]
MNDYCVKRKRVKMGTGDEGEYGGHVWLQPAVSQHAVVGTEVNSSDLSDSSDTDLLKHLGIDRQREVNRIRQQRYRARKRHRIQIIGSTNIHVTAAVMHTVMEEKVAGGCATIGRGIGAVGHPTRNSGDVINKTSTDDTNRGDINEGASGGSDVEKEHEGCHGPIDSGVIDMGSRGQDQQRCNRRRKQRRQGRSKKQRGRARQQLRDGVTEESLQNELSDNERAECMRRLQSALGADGLDEKGDRHGLERHG